MSDKLPDGASHVNDESPLLLHFPTTEAFDSHAAEILGYLRANGFTFESFTFRQKYEKAQLSIAAVEHFLRRGECVCLNCVRRYANGDPLLYMCVRAEVLIRTGRQCLQHAHINPVR